MNQPTTDLPQESASAVAESIVSVPKVAAPAKKAAAKTSVKATKPAAKSTPKASKKAAIKTAAKIPAKSTVKAAVSVPSPAPEVIKAPATKPEKTVKPKKDKLIRDSFTMPESEYNLVAEIKRRCLANGAAVKKSEILRAAIIGLAALPDASIRAALHALEIIKTGRPPKAAK